MYVCVATDVHRSRILIVKILSSRGRFSAGYNSHMVTTFVRSITEDSIHTEETVNIRLHTGESHLDTVLWSDVYVAECYSSVVLSRHFFLPGHHMSCHVMSCHVMSYLTIQNRRTSDCFYILFNTLSDMIWSVFCKPCVLFAILLIINLLIP